MFTSYTARAISEDPTDLDIQTYVYMMTSRARSAVDALSKYDFELDLESWKRWLKYMKMEIVNQFVSFI